MTEKVSMIELEYLKNALIEASKIFEDIDDEDSLNKLIAAQDAYFKYLETHD
ncbi:hypothetical protein [Methylotenera versatilis]|uniref:Uncharacterized protein n=1 Tax=Methylotenera versatilis (strain 301) TaxID=666681 RepID=D7DHK5_METV0|nr:hypothetical protein [Methylotenera versatilis]ADI29540.1 conserved hypothetical protein [Methylotenera versatilis 301]